MNALKNIAEHLLAERDEARAEVERLRAELQSAQDDARYRDEAEAASKADRAEVERLRAERDAGHLAAMRLIAREGALMADAERLRGERGRLAAAHVEAVGMIDRGDPDGAATALHNATCDPEWLPAEVERLREEISAVIADYGQMLMDGFNDCEAWEEAEARLSRALKRERSDD